MSGSSFNPVCRLRCLICLGYRTGILVHLSCGVITIQRDMHVPIDSAVIAVYWPYLEREQDSFEVRVPRSRAGDYGPDHLHASLPGKRPEPGSKDTMGSMYTFRGANIRLGLPLCVFSSCSCSLWLPALLFAVASRVRRHPTYAVDLDYNSLHEPGARGSIHGSSSTRPRHPICL